jgi:hypothetical protein
VALKYFNVKQGLTTGNVLISDGNVTLGNIGNVHISGGSSGQFIKTDGAGNLSFDAPVGSPAPMPTVVDIGETLTIPVDYQGLFAYPITVNGTLDIDGILIDVSSAGPGGTIGQIQYNDGADYGGTAGFTFDKITGNVAIPGSLNITGGFVKLTAYTDVVLRAITGVIGQIAVVSNSSPGGKMAFWDTTNNRWSYVNDNSAV